MNLDDNRVYIAKNRCSAQGGDSECLEGEVGGLHDALY